MRTLLLLPLAWAVALTALADGFDERTLRELEAALACVNLSLDDLSWDKRPVDDPFRLAVVNEALDRPLSLAEMADRAEREFGDDLVPLTYDLNREAAEIARAACDRHATAAAPRFVIGSMGPGTKLLSLGQTTWDIMLDSYREQARGLIDGGADALLIETCQDLLQVKCAINACLAALDERGRTALDVPIMVSVTIETTGTMLVGSETAES